MGAVGQGNAKLGPLYLCHCLCHPHLLRKADFLQQSLRRGQTEGWWFMEDATRERMGFGKTLASIGAAGKKRRSSSRRRHQLLSLQDQTLGGGKHEFPAKEGDQPTRSREPASPGEGRGEVQLDEPAPPGDPQPADDHPGEQEGVRPASRGLPASAWTPLLNPCPKRSKVEG